MKKIYYALLLTSVTALFSCSSGKKAFERGEYYNSVLKSVNRLRQNPDHKKSRGALKRGYPLAVQTLLTDAENSSASNARFKYRDALYAYQKINTMGDEIRHSPGALQVIPNPKNVSSKIATLKQQAAEESYNEGLIALSRKTRDDAKNAYYYLKDANEFAPGYKNVVERMEEALFIATLKVVVEQIPVPTRYELSANFFQDKVEEYLHTEFRSNPFVKFYTPKEAESEQLPYVDQYLRLQFDDFSVGQTHLERNTVTYSKDSVVVGTVTLEDGTKVDAYNTVHAKFTVNHKEVMSNGLLSMAAYDANSDAVLTHRKFPGEFVWYTEWGSFNGDERALTEGQLAIAGSQEVPPPPPQDLFIEFTRPIYDQLVKALNQFYSQL